MAPEQLGGVNGFASKCLRCVFDIAAPALVNENHLVPVDFVFRQWHAASEQAQWDSKLKGAEVRPMKFYIPDGGGMCYIMRSAHSMFSSVMVYG